MTLLKKAEGFYFRNYKDFSLEFERPLNILTGGNGQGKTAFLEAIYCALRGKSFQPSVSSQFIQEGRGQAEIRLDLNEEKGLSRLKAKFSLSSEGLKKELVYCGKKSAFSSLAAKAPCFVFTEDSMKCLRQGPEKRRAFVDETILPPAEKPGKDLFLKALRQKSRLLKDFRRGLLPEAEARKTLAALNPVFLKAGFQLAKGRLKSLARLFSALKGLRAEFFKAPLPALGFSYLVSGEDVSKKPFDDIFPVLERDLERKKEIELKAGLALSGPQKHEIVFLFKGRDSRFFCSKGEQRAFMLSLLAGHIKLYPSALLLLDDALLELDEKAQAQFLSFLEKSHCQSLLTGCKINSFKTEKMSFFSVKNGTIKQYA